MSQTWNSYNLKAKVIRGSMWTSLEQLCIQGLNFGMGIILARLLTPSDYGTVALVMVFVAVAQSLLNSGLAQALVQKKEIDELDINSILYLNLTLAAVLYAVLFFLAPNVAAYYCMPDLCPVLRVLAVTLIFNAVNSVQNADLCKRMKFDVSFRVSLVTTIVSAVVGIGLALAHFGVWALVWSVVMSAVAGMLVRAFVVSWRLRLAFSWTRIQPLFRYGSRLMANSLIGSVVGNLYGFMIGRFYARTDLAFVNKGRNIPELLMGNINTSLAEVSLPALVQLQDDREQMCHAMQRLLGFSAFIVFPLMFFLFAVSREMTLLFYGEKWASCIVYMQVTAILMSVGPIGAVNQKGLLAIGRSDIYLKVGLLRSALSIVILIVGLAHLSVLAWIVMNAILFGPLSAFIDMMCGSRFLNFDLRRQVCAIGPGFVLGLAVSLPVWAVNCLWSVTSPYLLLPILVVEGVWAFGIVVVSGTLFRMEAAIEISRLLEKKFGVHNRIFSFLLLKMEEGHRCLV